MRRGPCLYGIWALLAAAPAHAAQAGEGREWHEHTVEQAWLHAHDPTLISRRLLTELTYEDLDRNRSTIEIRWTGRGAVPIGENLAFGIQGSVPLKSYEAAANDQAGVGDLELRAGFVARASTTLRWGIALNAEFDTASDAALGDDVFELRPIFGIRWDARNWLNVGFNAEYSFTPGEEGSGDVSALELKFPAAVKFNEDWSGAVSYKPKWSFAGHDDLRQRLALEVGRVWGAGRNYALTLGAELPLSPQDSNWKLVGGIAWYFK